MNNWSNIEVSVEDSEIAEINHYAETLGDLSGNILKIRELISRFEVCHFKYQEHLQHITDSIHTLNPTIQPSTIGSYHISKGVDVISNDKTGRSIPGQQYVNSMKKWLEDDSQINSDFYSDDINKKVQALLGDPTRDKKRLVRLLLARLLWDWKTLEEYQQKEEYTDLEFQVCRMDICHYAFPDHLEIMLSAIGKLEPVKNFNGCGSFNQDIKNYIEKHFLKSCNYLQSNSNKQENNEKIKLWLMACLAKTLKEQTGLEEPLPKLINNK